jgi:Pyruvate/2-oxoglutarate dehydrogenase complex, dihydrolipoamide acyltransferase (E2) component, and related enzymes
VYPCSKVSVALSGSGLALVGFGKVIQKGGMMGVRRVVHATLSADHRVSDGHRGGLFLAAIERLLQEPEKL